MKLFFVVAAAATIAAAPPPVDPPPVPPSDLVTLSPAERAAALDAGAERASRDLPINGLVGRPHGEVGMAVDSRGGHSVYGVTSVPLGQTGAATFSFSNDRFRR